MTRHSPFLRAAFCGIALTLAIPAQVLADPPSHAPAHGWRKKHDPYYLGYTGKKWDDDYGILRGRCNADAVGAVVGGVVGGAIGSQVGKGSGRAVAIVVGTILGAAVGAKIGREVNDLDRACLGHALELAKDGRRVAWTNPETRVAYLLTPTRGFTRDGRNCREFVLESTANGKKHEVKRSACSAGEGRWEAF